MGEGDGEVKEVPIDTRIYNIKLKRDLTLNAWSFQMSTISFLTNYFL
jgi:hypothetical protein